VCVYIRRDPVRRDRTVRLYLLPDARSSRQDRSVAMHWLNRSMRFRSLRSVCPA